MNKFRSVILLTICIGFVYGMACFLWQSEPSKEMTQMLSPSPVVTPVQTSNLPNASSVGIQSVPDVPLAIRQIETPSASVSAVPMATTSSVTARSVAGGVSHYAAPVVPLTVYNQHTVAPTYAYNSTIGSHSPSVATPQSTVSQPMATRRRAPGTIGGDSGSWQGWLDDYYGDTGLPEGDLSGLNKWWNENIGGGNTPNIYDDFYNWAKDKYTPLSDGIWILLSLLLVYGVVLYKRTGNLKKYE